jgi:hypothetical protein
MDEGMDLRLPEKTLDTLRSLSLRLICFGYVCP